VVKSERTFHPGAASLVALVVASVACNAIFSITEGASRHSAAGDDDDTPAGVSGAKPGAGNTGIPQGGKGGAAAAGAAGFSMGGAKNAGTGGDTGAMGGGGNNGGAPAGGSNQGMGGGIEIGGTGGDTGAAGGNISGAAGTGGIGGAASGMAGIGGSAPLPLTSLPTLLIWPQCSEDTEQFSTTCQYYGDGESSCPSGGAVHRETHQIGGKRGDVYVAEIKTWGAVALHCFTGGTFVATDTAGVVWLKDGEPTADNGTVYELDVYEENGTAPIGAYHLNAYRRSPLLGSDVPDPPCNGDAIQNEGDSVTLELPGAGTVEVIIRDPDCVMTTNCNATSPTDTCFPYGRNSIQGEIPGPPFAAVTSTYAPKDDRYGDRSAAWSQFVVLQVVTLVSK